MDALTMHRWHFAFTVTYHYIFPQLTMGLALLIVLLKTEVLRTGSEHYNRSARFWAKIFGINFAMGVVTGIPMEFQFGTNWAQFSKRNRHSRLVHGACWNHVRIDIDGAWRALGRAED